MKIIAVLYRAKKGDRRTQNLPSLSIELRNALRYDPKVRPSITWTEDSEDHIARHSVRPHKVEEVLFMRPRYERRSRNETTECFGQTNAGRYLVVVICDALDDGTGIVTARDMDIDEKRQFQKRGR